MSYDSQSASGYNTLPGQTMEKRLKTTYPAAKSFSVTSAVSEGVK